jgi:hypothetical protein
MRHDTVLTILQDCDWEIPSALLYQIQNVFYLHNTKIVFYPLFPSQEQLTRECVLVPGSVDSVDLQLFSSDPYPLWVGINLTMSTLGGDKVLYELITTVFHEVQLN